MLVGLKKKEFGEDTKKVTMRIILGSVFSLLNCQWAILVNKLQNLLAISVGSETSKVSFKNIIYFRFRSILVYNFIQYPPSGFFIKPVF